MKNKKNSDGEESKLEAGLRQALTAVDNQIARALQRTPTERELLGVQKWQPYEERVEQLTEYLLAGLGAKHFDLDGLIVLSQALTKSMSMLAQDLGPIELGEMRSQYLLKAFEALESDTYKGRQALNAAGASAVN